MRNHKRLREHCGLLVVSLIAAAGAGWLMVGCSSDSSGLFASGKWRTFGSSEAPTPAPVPAANRRPEPAKNIRPAPPRREDPAVVRTQQQVNDEVERMRQAMEQASAKSSTGVVAKATPVVEDSDSLAAKLAQPDAPPAAVRPIPPDRQSPVVRPASSPTAEQPTGERPVIRRIPRTPKAEPAVVKEPAKAPSGTAGVARRSAPIEITAVEPVKSAAMAPEPPQVSPAEAAPESAGSAPAPANTAAKLDVSMVEDPEAAMDRVISQLERKVKDRPEDTNAQLKLRLIYTLRGQWQQALKDRGDKSTPTDELARNVAALIKTFESGDGNSARQANEALKVINEMKELLSRQADLVINNMQLCWKVDSYGSYKIMPADYFVAGKRLPVIVYLELENFTSKYLPDKNGYQTLLSMGIEVLDTTGRRLWEDHYDKIEDLASRPRRDFFLGTRVTLPASLPEGKLRLKVTLEDQHGNKSSQKMIDFEIRAK